MKAYDKYFEDFDIYDCIVGKDIVGLLARESDKPLSEIINTKLVIDDIDVDFGGKNAGFADMQHMTDAKGCIVQIPEPAFILVSSNGQVFKSGYENNENIQKFESDITKGSPLITNVKAINEKAYAVSTHRQVYRRDGVDVWTNISKQISDDVLVDGEAIEKGGFNDIDGFAENDLYAVGYDGDCWYFDGSSWRRIDLPVNIWLKTVCCAEDGFVYIGGMFETILKGKGDNWEIISSKDSEYLIRKIVSFQGKVYLSTLNGLFKLDGNNLEEVDFDGLPVSDFGYLGVNVNNTKLVTGGPLAAYFFDGESWNQLINIFS